jgi:hypothetical protein
MSDAPGDRPGAAWGWQERLPAVVLFLVNPLLLLPFFADPDLPRWLLVAASLAVALPFDAGRRRLLPGLARELWPLAALAALIAGHLAAGSPVAEGSRWLVLVALGAVAYAWGRSLDPGGRERCLTLLESAAAAVGAYAVAQAFGWDVIAYPAESWVYRVVTTFGHRNFTATFLMTAVFASLARREVGPRPRVFLAVAGLGLLATGSRFPILAAGAALVVHLGRRRGARRAALVAAAAVVAIVALAVARGEVATALGRTESVVLRSHLFRSLLTLAGEHPFLGGGPGEVARAVPAVVGPATPEHGANLVFLHAHHLPADLAIDLGLVGLALFAVFLAPLYARLVRAGWRTWGWLVWGHLAWVVVNLYDVAFFTYPGWLALWPLLGIVRSDLDDRPPEGVDSRCSHWAGATAGVVAVACLLGLARMAWSSHLCATAAAAHAARQMTAAAAGYEAAARCWPLPLEQRYRRASATLDAGLVDAAIAELTALETQAPAFASVRHLLALAYARRGELGQALTWVDRHLAAHPGDAAAAADRQRLLATVPQL